MKRFLIINRHAPYGTFFGKEALDAALMASAFAETALLFMDDGVFQLTRDQKPEGIGLEPYTQGFGALPHYEVKEIFVSADSLAERSLAPEDLAVAATPVSAGEIRALIDTRDVILSF